jgi:ribosomal protein S16
VELVVNIERAKHWFQNGAKPTDTARDLLVKAGIPDSEVPPVVR